MRIPCRSVSFRLGTGLLVVSLISGCTLLREREKVGSGGGTNSDAEMILSLQKKLEERDRRIAELTFQLNTLKRIDHDVEERRTPIRPPAILTPLDTDRRP